MKIHPLRHGVSFHSSVSFQKVKGVDELVASSHKTAICICDIIGYVPAINIVNRHDVFCVYFITYSTL